MFLTGLLCAILFVLSTSAKQDNWGYDSRNGPSSWLGACDTGHRQSPIDIRSVDVDYAVLKKLHFVNYMRTGTVKLQNNGHTVMVTGFADWGESQPFIFGGALEGRYRLLQIHFHWATEDTRGSEHTLASLHYPLEAHFVHQKEGTHNLSSLPGDGLAVVGLFLNIQQDGSPFSNLEAGLKQVEQPDTTVKIEHYNAMQMLPNNKDTFYTYEGSLTTPGCHETVIWTVLAEPSSITKSQAKKSMQLHSIDLPGKSGGFAESLVKWCVHRFGCVYLEALFKNGDDCLIGRLQLLRNIRSNDGRVHEYNYRPTQPLNGRRIKYRAISTDRTEICQESGAADKLAFWSMIGVFAVISLKRISLLLSNPRIQCTKHNQHGQIPADLHASLGVPPSKIKSTICSAIIGQPMIHNGFAKDVAVQRI
ncbi:hypothetical protein M3Y97_00311600 [Aphelenchoides bicaudatus]|nr:hypothetical protein M3Y97_00311600 [Aphelenchoides bicaudatus]